MIERCIIFILLLSGTGMVRSNVGHGHQSLPALVDGQGPHRGFLAGCGPWPRKTVGWHAQGPVWP